MLLFMQPNESQIGIINHEKSKLEVHHRDGCGFNNEVTNLEIVTPQQNMRMARGNSVTALYADSNNLYMQFETQTDACAYFGIALNAFLSYLNSKERQIEKNGQFFITGEPVGRLAGNMFHTGRVIVLLLKFIYFFCQVEIKN